MVSDAAAGARRLSWHPELVEGLPKPKMSRSPWIYP